MMRPLLLAWLLLACSHHVDPAGEPTPLLGEVNFLSVVRWSHACRAPLDMEVHCHSTDDKPDIRGIDAEWNCSAYDYLIACPTKPGWNIAIFPDGKIHRACLNGPEPSLRPYAASILAKLVASDVASRLSAVFPNANEVKDVEGLIVMSAGPLDSQFEACWEQATLH